MLIDSFTFYNELELLEFRLRLLYDYVDKFVLVEGDKTFAGKDKPFYFEQARDRFAWANDKVIYHQASLSVNGMPLDDKPQDYDPESTFFKLEYQQRNAIADACGPFSDDCTVLLSDVDELPSREVIQALRKYEGQMFDPFAFEQRLFYYTLDHEMVKPWRGTVGVPLGVMRQHTPQTVRHVRTQLPHAPGGGWHLSYFGSPEFIANKIDSFAHQEFNQERFKDPAHLARCIERGADPFGRDDIIEFKSAARDSFPPYFLALTAPNERFFFRDSA